MALACAGGLLTTVGLAGLGPLAATASSHREAPLIAGTPQYDNTDLYAFRSPEKQNTVTLVANWLPFEEPAGGPNFYTFATDAQYDIHVDNDADAKADVTFRWTFKDHYVTKDTFLYTTGPVTSLADKDLNYYQTYRLVRINRSPARPRSIVGKKRVAPSNVGKASMPNYAALRDQAVTTPRRTCKSFAGQAEDPFFLDLRVFDLLYGGDLSEVRRRHARRLQRQLGGAPGAAEVGGQEREGEEEPGHRHLDHDAEEGRQRQVTARSRAWATRWSTRSSSR